MDNKRIAAIAKNQINKAKEEQFYTVQEINKELNNFYSLDHNIAVKKLVTEGYTEKQATTLVEHKPLSLQATIAKIATLGQDIQSVTEYLSNETEFLNIKDHLYKSGGDLYVSSSLFTTLVIRETKIGAAMGLYLLVKLREKSKGAGATFAALNDSDKEYLGYSKAVKISLHEMLSEFEFVEPEYDNGSGLMPEHKLREAEVISLMNSLANGLMVGCGDVDVHFLGDVEGIVTFSSLGLYPSDKLLNWINMGRVTVTVEVVQLGRNNVIRVENIWFDGSLWFDFYNCCLQSSIRTKKENQL